MSGYSHATVSITATASQVFSANPSENDGVLVQNRGSVAVYLGGSTVTADDTGTGGLLVNPGETVTVSTSGASSLALYGITASGTATVSWLAID